MTCDRPVSTTNKPDRHDITEILLKVALNTMNPIPIILILASKERAELNSKDTNNFFMYVTYSIVHVNVLKVVYQRNNMVN